MFTFCRKIYLTLLTISALCTCKTPVTKQVTIANSNISNIINQMMDLMIHDVTNPPLAGRFFAYTMLSGYEVVVQNNPQFTSYYNTLNKYPVFAKQDSITGFNYQLSALVAMLETAAKLQPSGTKLLLYEEQLLSDYKLMGLSDETILQSKKYGQAVSEKILLYAKADGYNKISNYQRYTPTGKPGSWYPTPPAFIEAVEPWFKTVRPFTLDTCSQFKPVAPIAFSSEKKSAFYKQMLINYTDTLTNEKKVIAGFWDCNPFAIQDNGHLMVGIKKISPGAHWMGIAGLACKQADKSFNETIQILSAVSVGLMDAFICCWDEKYRSDRMRPETAIRKYIDDKWEPLLQTPPFPEYLSGHSVVSGCSSTILTHYLGNNFAYTDSVEVKYGLPSRRFTSFNKAAEEAAISRFYGGIHFMDAITVGLDQGKKVGGWVLHKMTRGGEVAKQQK